MSLHDVIGQLLRTRASRWVFAFFLTTTAAFAVWAQLGIGGAGLSRIDGLGTVTLVGSPLTSGITAWLVQRDNHRLGEYTRRLDANPLSTALPIAVAVWLLWTGAHLAALASLLLLNPGYWSVHPLWLLTWLVPSALMLPSIVIAAVLGTWMKSRALPVIITASGLVAPALPGHAGVTTLLLVSGGASPESPQLTFTPRLSVIIAQLACGLLILALLTIASSNVSKVVRVASLIVCGTGLVASFAFLQSTEQSRFTIAPSESGAATRQNPSSP